MANITCNTQNMLGMESINTWWVCTDGNEMSRSLTWRTIVGSRELFAFASARRAPERILLQDCVQLTGLKFDGVAPSVPSVITASWSSQI